jgi:hypothetical protein
MAGTIRLAEARDGRGEDLDPAARGFEGRAGWVDEEMATLIEPGTYEANPEQAWRRLKLRVKNRKGLAVLIELAAWRERTAQERNLPSPVPCSSLAS